MVSINDTDWHGWRQHAPGWLCRQVLSLKQGALLEAPAGADLGDGGSGDVNGATDVSGPTIGGKSPEAFVGTDDTSTAAAQVLVRRVHGAGAGKRAATWAGNRTSETCEVSRPAALVGEGRVSAR
jgi:uncharacterized protein YidB (DUF937 family)